MSLELISIGAVLLAATVVAAGLKQSFFITRSFFSLGVLFLLIGSMFALPHGTRGVELFPSGGLAVTFSLDASASWLVAWGLAPALFAGITISRSRISQGWYGGAALTILGAIGVAGLQDGISFLIAWEVMSLGGAFLLLNDRRAPTADAGQSNLFMLSLLEVGSVSLLIGMLVLGSRDPSFSVWHGLWLGLSPLETFGIGVLFLIGFGAKLGVLPFYEWYPSAYSSGSGATGAILSGVVLNVAWYSLGRALLHWMPASKTPLLFGVLVLAAGVISAILSILYGFQQGDWRKLLSFSTAENGGLATAALGAAIMFRVAGLPDLSTLAWVVGLLHLGGHSLAKGSLMITADQIYETGGTYEISQHDALSRAPWTLGVGAVMGGMSLSAMPPMAGFVSEWFLFQTLFQAFRFTSSTGRVALALAGAGIALTAALSLATMMKVLGVGMLGKNQNRTPQRQTLPVDQKSRSLAVLSLGTLALVYSVGMIWWIRELTYASWIGPSQTVNHMVDGLLLVPLSSGFAFISPFLLVVVGGLLSLIPLALIRLRRHGINGYRKVPIWAQGLEKVPESSATTALVFSNALRQFYSFIYRPKTVAKSDGNEKGYFVKQVSFEYSVAPIFGPFLFSPIVRLVRWTSEKTSKMQMGSMNVYILYIGLMLILILAIAIFI
ncbi:proton-conducting transporter membrane subunit [Acidithrix sp. C25]|uniref:proton-conducting transporter transmembrane domain-containing protein n=1 Tax=Acidithrix sp. C25 TaxID=1671482 RepID=UPI00191B9455|nr:proton-conducting transporter membrane subunit [Acidithrix sp. C25]CAG4930616.1 unnamed protein product [Acidithrix sp. C25]